MTRTDRRRFPVLFAAIAALALAALVLSTGNVSAAPRQQTVVNICDRTAEVQAAILAEVPSSTCSAVTDTQLAGITHLAITDYSSASIVSSDFAGLTGLSRLDITDSPDLTIVPANAFSELADLSNFTKLGLVRTAIHTVQPGAFDGLTRLVSLDLRFNSLKSLEDDIFRNLPALESIDLSHNNISTLPKDIFQGLTKLEELYLYNNDLRTLDKDIFDGLTNLKWLYLYNNHLTTLHEDTFDGLTNLERLYLLGNDLRSLPADIFDGLTNLKWLYLYNNHLTTLHEDIFDGLTNLERLVLYENRLTTLDEDIFDGLTSLDWLWLYENRLTTLHEDIFDGLTSVRWLRLYDNDLTHLHEDTFDGLTSLEQLYLYDNDLRSLPADIFDGLTNLRRLFLYDNDLRTLDEDIFDGLTNLWWLYLHDNELTTLDEDIFDGLTDLQRLHLYDNELTTLDKDIFDGLTDLQELYLQDNSLTTLETELFAPLDDSLSQLVLTDNSLTTLPAGIFSGLTALKSLDLSCNELTELEFTQFDPFAASLTFLDITSNNFTTEPTVAEVQAKLTAVEAQNLYISGTNTGCAASTDTGLSALSLSDGVLTPAFVAPGRSSYRTTVPHDVSSMTVHVTPRDTNAVITNVTYGNDLYDNDPNTPGLQIDLKSTQEYVSWRVVARDGFTFSDYYISIHRDYPPSSDATLRSLSLSGIPPLEAFSPDKFQYSAKAPSSVSSTRVTAVPNDPDASVVIRVIAGGSLNAARTTVTLAEGANLIRVEVTAEDGTEMTYAVSVLRDYELPVLRNVSIVNGPGSDGVWSAGERVYVEARYSLPVVVEQPEDCWSYNDDGTCRPPGPFVVVAFRSDARPESGYDGWLSPPLARYVSGSGTATLSFAYRVSTVEEDAERVVVADNGMLLRGATIRPLRGGDAELSEYTNTRVRQVDVVKPGGGMWTAGDTVRVKVRFAGPVQYAPPDEPQNRDEVFVDERRGTPTIRLRLGEAPNPRLPRTARYELGSGTDTLTFEYEVRAGDGRVSVVEAVADSLAANGATIRNEDGYDAELNHVDVLWYSWLALRVRHAAAREGEPLRFTLELARASQAPVTVDYETADGTATAGEDYTAKRGTVTFTPGRTRRTVEVPVLRDGKVEGVETMVLRLSNARSEGSEVPVEMKVSEAQGAIENVVPEVNTPATGVPTINGTAQVGETLTAGTSGIADANGLTNVSYNYQWLADDADIAGATGYRYTLADSDEGRTIRVRVTFTDDAGNEESLTSAPTEPVLEEPVFGDGPPGAPRNLTVTAGDQEVTLSWEPPADNGNAPATRYRIEWRIDGKDYKKGHWGPSGETTYTKTDLANGVKYIFRVKAENGNGNSYGPYGPASEEVSATPTSGSAVDLGTPVLSNTKTLHHGMVKLDWEDVEDAGWYVVQYYHAKGGEWLDLPAEGVDIAFHGSSAVVSNLHGLSWLRVRAMSCAGESEWSQIEELYGTNASDWEGVPVPEVEEGDEIEPCPVVLGTPVLSNTETLHHGMVRLDWEDIEDAGWYVVQYYHAKGGEWLDLPAEGVDIAFHGSSAVVSNLHGLSWLRVRAMSCAGASEWSQIEELYGTNASDWEGVPVPEVEEGNEIEPCSEDADTPENSPATGAPTISGTAQVGETLTANTSGIADADGLSNVQYEYQWLADDSDISGATNATHTLADADEGKAIMVQVSFTDDAGNDETLTSEATDAVAAAPAANNPATGAPTISGTAQVGETLTADRSGIADADGLSNVQYEYQWLADDTAIQGATDATHTLANTEEGKAIKVQVSFTDDAGNNEALTSAATGAVSAAEPTEPPARPTGLSATASHDSVTLTWDDPGDDSITGYVILRRVRVNNTGGDFSELVADTGTAATTYTDDTVAAGTTYTYRIKAINGAGTSERSRWFHIDTPAAPVPDKPTGLSATASHDSVTLTWEDPGDDSITGYVILRRLRYDDPSGHFDELVADTGTAATTYTDDTVKANTHYTYRIKAISGAGVSERSRWFHIHTPAAP